MIRRLAIALSATAVPLLACELAGGRAALGMLSGGDPAQAVKAVLFVVAWVWAVLSCVPLSVGALAFGAPR